MCTQVTELENRLHHTTMSASEEKRVVDEIGKLRRSKKAAAGVDKKGEQAGLSEKRVDDLRAEIKEFDTELNAIKEEQVFLPLPDDLPFNLAHLRCQFYANQELHRPGDGM